MRTQRLRGVLFSLLAVTGLAVPPGCGSEPAAPEVGTKEFESAREEYQNVRKQEYQRESLDPKAKAKPLPKAGGQ